MNDRAFSDAGLRELRVQAPAPPDEVLAARRLLNAAIAAERRPQRGRLGRLVAAASGVAAVVAALAVAMTVTTVRAPSATAVLFDLVGAVTRSAPIDATAGEFVYVRTEGVTLRGSEVTLEGAGRDDIVWLQPFVDERWFAPDGSFRQHFVPAEPRFFTDEDREIWEADPAIQGADPGEFTVDLEPPIEPVLLGDLPLDTAALRAALVEAYQLESPDRVNPVEAELLDIAADIARRHDAGPELRGAVLELMAQTPGLEVVDHGLDTVTLGVEYDTVGDARLRQEHVFAAATGRLVESRLVYVEPPPGSNIPPGTTEHLRFDAPVVVDEIG